MAALCLTACHKDPQPNPDDQPEQIPTGDGVYNPGRHITSIASNNGATETWLWENKKLMSITETDEDGYSSVSSFGYDGWRLTRATLTGDIAGTATYTYSGDKMTNFSVSSGGMQVATADVVHTGDKVTHLDLNLNEEMLQMLISMMGDGGFPFPFKGGKSGNKLSLSSTDFDADLIWEGDNVSRMVLSGQVVMGVTVDELRQFLPLDSIMGSMASLLTYITAGQELPLTININDTTDLDYDSHTNPLQGFLGKLDPSILSANNVTSVENYGIMSAVLTITIPYLGSHDINYDIPLGDGMTQTFTYTYDAAGYPTAVVDNDGVMKTYTYQEQ